MTEENTTENPAENVAVPDAAPAQAARGRERGNDDLSSEIVRTVEKNREDRVTCRLIFGNNYRCNWWAPANLAGYDNPSMQGLLVTTHRVRKSQFLSVTKTNGALVIQPWKPRGG